MVSPLVAPFATMMFRQAVEAEESDSGEVRVEKKRSGGTEKPLDQEAFGIRPLQEAYPRHYHTSQHVHFTDEPADEEDTAGLAMTREVGILQHNRPWSPNDH